MSATSKQGPERELFETGSEPEFFVSEIRTEQAEGGNVRVMAYKLTHGRELHLLFTAIVPAQSLVVMARQAMEAASDAHNLEMWKSDGDPH